jgi:hypothetical protein
VRTALSVVLGIALAASQATAQTMGGTVTSQRTGQPVAGTLVQLLDQGGAVVARVESDAEGRYGVVAPTPGTYRLRFLVPGYRSLVSPPLELAAGQTLEYSLQLTAVAPELLDTLIVEGRPIAAYIAPFYRRREFGLGRFMTRAEIEKTGASDVSGLVRRMNVFDILGDPGDGTGQRFGQRARTGRGFCPAALFLNGAYAGRFGEVDVDMLLPLDGTEAIEVYRGGEPIPPELRAPTAPVRGAPSTCGVVSLWSRMSAPDTTRVIRHLALATHAGVRLGADGVREGRVGLALSYTIRGAVEFYPGVNVFPGIPDPGEEPAPSGWQLVLALRARPLGRESPWYVGLGISHVQLTGQSIAGPAGSNTTDEQHHIFVTGLLLPAGTWQPYVEVQILDALRLSSAQTSVFVGLAYRAF